MDWDDIARKLRMFEDLASRLSSGPIDEYVKRQSQIEKRMRRLGGPLDSFAQRQLDAFNSMQRLSEGPLQDFIKRQQELEATFLKVSTSPTLAADQIAAFDLRWQSIASKLNLRLTGPGKWIEDLQEGLREADARLASANEGRGLRRPTTADAPRSVPSNGDSVRATAAARVLQGAHDVLVIARDRKKPRKLRYEALAIYLQLILWVLSAFQEAQREAADDRRSADVVNAVVKTGEAVVSAMKRLRDPVSTQDAKTTAVVKRSAPLRTSRSARSHLLATLRAGQDVGVVRHAGSWLLVEVVTTGEEPLLGWMHIENLRLKLDD